MTDPAAQARRLVRRRFDRIAAIYEPAAVVEREAGARMLERLDLVRLRPQRVLDAGCGTGHLTRALRVRYPAAQLVGVDLSMAMLRQGRPGRGWWRQLMARARGAATAPLCADLQRLPLASGSIDLACSAFALEWVGDLRSALSELRRTLRRGGLLMFVTLGPDTLKELRAALAPDGTLASPYIDMHDLGDALVGAGFADPVMDMEQFTLTYRALPDLLRDLRSAGTRAARTPAQGLRGRGWIERTAQRYEAARREGLLPATFEVVYGHAWNPEQPRRTDDGRAIVRFERPRRRGE
jgi:malonyl-CoA O-methyltransferase